MREKGLDPSEPVCEKKSLQAMSRLCDLAAEVSRELALSGAIPRSALSSFIRAISVLSKPALPVAAQLSAGVGVAVGGMAVSVGSGGTGVSVASGGAGGGGGGGFGVEVGMGETGVGVGFAGLVALPSGVGEANLGFTVGVGVPFAGVSVGVADASPIGCPGVGVGDC
jgi:hypothetical protein